MLLIVLNHSRDPNASRLAGIHIANSDGHCVNAHATHHHTHPNNASATPTALTVKDGARFDDNMAIVSAIHSTMGYTSDKKLNKARTDGTDNTTHTVVYYADNDIFSVDNGNECDMQAR